MIDFNEKEQESYNTCVNSVKDVALNYQMLKNTPVPEEMIREQIVSHIKMYFEKEFDEKIKEELFNQIKHEIDVTIVETEKKGECLEDKKQNHIPWLDEAIKDTSITWSHWRYYKDLILDGKKPSSKIRVMRLDSESNDILSRIENPKREGAWDNRGLVVGDVQAGKTSNYVGLLAKAVDAGYKVIIVLAGSTNDLRKQTQERIDDGLLGYRSDKNGQNGIVIKTPITGKVIQPQTSSAANGDYKRGQFFKNITGEDCYLYVVKKNGSVLRNILLDLIKQKSISNTDLIKDTPLLLIDDEADNASPNTNLHIVKDPLTGETLDDEDYDPTCINRYIRAILSCFEKTAYIGYTATPYANIFELPNHGKATEYFDEKLGQKILIGEDLFPRNFIYKLYTPTNYIGVEKLFGTDEKDDDGLPLVIKVDEKFPEDFEEVETKRKKKKQQLVDDPSSLKYAINCFILSSIAKNLRKGVRPIHNTMLVHINRLTKKMAVISEWVGDYIHYLKDLFSIGTKQKQSRFIDKLKGIWESEYVAKFEVINSQTNSSLVKLENWGKIELMISSFVNKLCYKTVNGITLDALDYGNHPEGLNVIAIGGDKLARGLTLEGLTISYFLRNAGAYDTLSQMGRWFGYKDDYIDLCRIFMLHTTYNNFREIAYATKDLYQQFSDLVKQRDRTPIDYGLRVLTDPRSKLLVTSAGKAKTVTKHKISFSGSPVPTAYLPKSEEANKKNISILRQFIEVLGKESGRGSSIRNNDTPDSSSYYWENVPTSQVLHKFLKTGYTVDGQNSWFTLSQIAEFIEKTTSKYNEITSWTVVLINGDDKKCPLFKFSSSLAVVPSHRKLEPMEAEQNYYELSRRRLPTGTNEAFDLTEQQFEAALKQTNSERARKGKNATKTPNSHYIRTNRDKSKALLLIYALHLETYEKEDIDTIIPGFMISFPELNHREMDQSFWANVVYEKNGKTADMVFNENGGSLD